MKKSFINKICIALTIVWVLCMLAGCESKPSPSDTIAVFERAYNKADMELMLDCIDPSIADSVRSGLSFFGGMMDIDMVSLMGMMPLLKLFADDDIDYPVIKITVRDQQIEGNEAVLNCLFEATANSDNMAIEIRVFMFFQDDHWYIENVEELGY